MTTDAPIAGPHACALMRMMVEDRRFSVEYNPRYRDYVIADSMPDPSPDLRVVQRIEYCPWCGTSLPSSLHDEWWAEVDAATGGTFTLGDPLEDVPEELRTDAWWRRRLGDEDRTR